MICYFIIEFNRSADSNINSFDKLYSQIGYVLEEYDIGIDFETTKRNYGIAGLVTFPSNLSGGQFNSISYYLDKFTEDKRVSKVIKVNSCKLCPYAKCRDDKVYCVAGIGIYPQIINLDKIDDNCPLSSKMDNVYALLEDIGYSLGRPALGEKPDIDTIVKDLEQIRKLLKLPDPDDYYEPEED